jgi:hypothetical protein
MRAQTAPMPAQAAKADYRLLAIGAFVTAGGGYFMLAGAGLVPPPGEAHAPGWIVALFGLSLVLGGTAVALRGHLNMDDSASEAPPGTPLWIRLTFWLSGVGIAACLAIIATWIALGDGERSFKVAGAFSGAAGDNFGRVVFGIGAVATWLAVIAFVHAGARRIFGRQG